MPLNTNVTLNVKTTWSQTDSGNGSVNSDVGSVECLTTLTSGTGQNQVNVLYYDSGTLGAGEDKQINLTSLPTNCLGISFNKSFETGNIKVIVIENTATGLNCDFNVRATGSNNWTEPFNGTGNLPVRASSPLVISDPLTGYTVNSSNRMLQLVDQGNGCEYRLFLAGSTGVV